MIRSFSRDDCSLVNELRGYLFRSFTWDLWRLEDANLCLCGLLLELFHPTISVVELERIIGMMSGSYGRRWGTARLNLVPVVGHVSPLESECGESPEFTWKFLHK